MSNAIQTISNSLVSGVVNAQSMVVLTKKQNSQIALVQDYANNGDLSDLETSKDKQLSGMVLNARLSARIQEELTKWSTSGNPSGLVRLVNATVGATNVPKMSAKKAAILGYESECKAWTKYTDKGDARTEKTRATYERAIAWLTPVFAAIQAANTISEAPKAPELTT